MEDLAEMLHNNHGLRPGGKAPAMSSVKRTPAVSGSSGWPVDGGGGSSGRNSYKPPSTDFGDLGSMGYANSYKSPVPDSVSFANDGFFSELGGVPSSTGHGLSSDGGANKTRSDLNKDLFGGSGTASGFDTKPKVTGAGNGESFFGADDVAFSVANTSPSRGMPASASRFDDLLGVGSLDSSFRTQNSNPPRDAAASNEEDLLGVFSNSGRKTMAAADPFADVATESTGSGPPSSSPGDPFGEPLFFSSHPSHVQKPNSSLGGGLDDLENFANGSSSVEAPLREGSGWYGRSQGGVEETGKVNNVSQRRGHAAEAGSLPKSRSSARSGEATAKSSAPGPYSEPSAPLPPSSTRRTATDMGTDEVGWLRVEDVQLQTQPVPMPPSRPPPPVTPRTMPAAPLPAEKYSRKPERHGSDFDADLESQPHPPPDVRSVGRKPTGPAKDAGKGARAEQGGLDGLEDFAAAKGGGRPPHQTGKGTVDEGLDEFARGGGADAGGGGSQTGGREESIDGGLDSSTSAMKAVLEKAQHKAEVARLARERKRQEEKEEAERRKRAGAREEQRGGTASPSTVKAGGPVNSNELSSGRQAKKSAGDDWMHVLGSGAGVEKQADGGSDSVRQSGEPEERFRARREREMRVKERGKAAVREKVEREATVLQEQAERDRAGDMLDAEIRKWAAGKQGNVRALLSTLQYVLWPECNWQPVSLTDIISGASVKKVYRKATLCVHPDKVQQKGATIQQKYIAEKVFDLLKESYNKFNSEELF